MYIVDIFSFYSEANVNPRSGKKNGEHLENSAFPSHAFPAVLFCFVFSLDLHFSSLSGMAESWVSGIEKRWNTKKRQRKGNLFYCGHADGGIHYHKSDRMCYRLLISGPF